MLTSEQTEEIKKEIINQIEKSFPDSKKEFATNQIKAMNSQQLEEFLKKNHIDYPGIPEEFKREELSKKAFSECVFCSIISDQINSYKIDENNKALAVLEINPFSKGHTLVIPKEHPSSSEKMHSGVFSLAKKVGKRLKTKFKPENIEISSSNIFGHEIINVVPIYGNKKSEKRNAAKSEELSEIQKILSKPRKSVKRPKKKKIILKESEKHIWLPKRIP